MTIPTGHQLPSRRRILGQSLTTAIAAVGALHVSAAERPRIRIGQIGTRHAHASGKMQAMRQLDDLFEVVGVVEPDKQRREVLSAREPYRGLSWMTIEQLLNVEGLSAVAVETEVDSLVPTAMQAVQANLHVHLDKPAGPSMSAYRQLRAEAERRGVTIQMGYMLRYNPAFTLLFQMVRDGWLGPLTELDAMMGKLADDRLRKQLAQFEGGGMFELACHLIDAMVTVLGKPNAVTAHGRQTFPDRDGFADNQLAVFDYPNLAATIRCNHLDPFGFPRRQFHVVGQQGYFKIQPLEPPRVELALQRARGRFSKGIQTVDVPPTTGRYDEEFRDLARVIRGEKELAWDAAHDLVVHQAVLQASGMPLD